MRCVIAGAAAASVLLITPAAGETPQALDSGAASVSFPVGTPQRLDGAGDVWTVSRADETFTALAAPAIPGPDADRALRTCPAPPPPGEPQPAAIACSVAEDEGDVVKQISVARPGGALFAQRMILHNGRIYQAQYVRRGGAGAPSAEGQRFLASLRIRH